MNILAKLFLLASMSYGIGFTFFSYTVIVNKSSLFITMADLSYWTPIIWGVVLLIACAIALISEAKQFLPGTFLGAVAWTFAAVVWAMAGGWLTIMSVALPNALFWFYFNASNMTKYMHD